MSKQPHPLFGAEQRVDRAATHIKELYERIQKWADAHADNAVLERNPETGEFYFQGEGLPIEMLGGVSMVIGDALYNLRSALEYLVYQLAVLGNDGKHVGGTQFPIEDDPDEFTARFTGKHPSIEGKKGKRKKFLNHVPVEAVDIIRELQPFSGCRWTLLLRELSNPDKHRSLNALRSKAIFQESESGTTRTEEGTVLNIKGNFEIEVFFAGAGTEVVDTLEFIERNVRLTIQLFKRGFGVRESGAV